MGRSVLFREVECRAMGASACQILHVFPIQIPPLRDRTEDVPVLLD